MANQEHLDKLNEGVEAWNQWRRDRPKIYPNLSGADLSGADLSGANLSSTDLSDACLIYAIMYRFSLHDKDLSDYSLTCANLSNTNLHNADLSGVDLLCVDLHDADLCDANLRDANLSSANLSGTKLHNAYLYNANLRHANLSGADLQGAIVGNTIFTQIDLREAKGLIGLRHHGSSRVELSTVELPSNGSAIHFLRGAGVPDEWIDFYRSTIMHPIQYHSCFISHSSKDDLLAHRLHADLQDHGVRCWFAPHDMKIGDRIRPCIDEAIHLQDKLLLLLSEHALASNWVEDEVEAALEKEQCQQREVLFPVRLDESILHTTQAWAAKLRRTRHIGDFTRWKDHDAYQLAFTRLLRDLKAQSQDTQP